MSLVTAVEILNYKLASFSPHIIIILNAFYLVFMYNIHRAYNCKRCKQYELYCMKLMFRKFSNKIFLLSAKQLNLIWEFMQKHWDFFLHCFNVLISNFPKKQLYYAGHLKIQNYLVFCISHRTATLQLASGAPLSTNILVRLFFNPKIFIALILVSQERCACLTRPPSLRLNARHLPVPVRNYSG